jgi:WD40 repeat protein
MQKNSIRFYLVVGLTVLALAACQTPTTAPIATEAPGPSAQPAVITAQNAADLQAAYQTSEINMISDLVWSTDGSILVALSSSGAARYNGSDLEIIDTFTFDFPAAIYAASPDGKTLAFSEDSYNIFLADASQTRDALTIYSPEMVGMADFSTDGSSLLTTSMDTIMVTLWDVNTGEVQASLDSFETAAPVYSAHFGADGQHIIWIARATVQLTDIATQLMGPVMSHEDFVVSTALAPNGSLLATAAAGTIDGEFLPAVFLWNADTSNLETTLTNPDAFNVVTFSPDSSLLAAASGSTLLFWDSTSFEQIASIDTGSDNIAELAFSPDGASLASADLSGNISLWQVP